MRPFIHPLQLARFAAGLLLIAHLFSAAGPLRAQEKTRAGAAPPQPIAATIKAPRGKETEIPLRIIGRRQQSMTFLIRRQPAAGKLTEPENQAAHWATVRYTPPADRAIVQDSFTFAVRTTDGVSAPVTMRIEIIDTPADLGTVAELQFERQLVGRNGTLPLEVVNRGGDAAEGEIQLDPPWKVEGSSHYKIEGGGRAFFQILFAPELPGTFTGELRFSSQPERVVALSGEAIAPIAVRPAALELRRDALVETRSGTFEITNNTEAEQVLAVHASERLRMERKLTIAAGRKLAVTVVTRPDDTEALEEVIRFTSGEHVAVLPIRAAELSLTPVADGVAQQPEIASSAMPTAAEPQPSPAPAQRRPSRRSSSAPAAPRVSAAAFPAEENTRDSAAEGEEQRPVFLPPSRVVSAGRTSVTLEFAPKPNAKSYRAEVMDLRLDGKRLQSVWIPFERFTSEAKGDQMRGTFAGLPPKGNFRVRVLATTAEGKSEPVLERTIDTLSPGVVARLFSPLRLLLIALVVLLGIIGWKRWSHRSSGL